MQILKCVWSWLFLCVVVVTLLSVHFDNQLTFAARLNDSEPFLVEIHPLLHDSTDSAPVNPNQIGESISTSLNIISIAESSRSQTISVPGSAFIKVHFDTWTVPQGWYVTVSDQDGFETYAYASDAIQADKDGFWAMSVMGETAVITLHPPASSTTQPTQAAIHIDKYIRGFSSNDMQSPTNPESTCGSLDRDDVICYESSHPTEYENSNAVVNIMYLVNGEPQNCTGWRATQLNRIITNEHCINSQDRVDDLEVWFDHKALSCGGQPNPNVVKVSGNTLLMSDFIHDIAIFTINDFASVQQFGYLDFDIRPPILGEEIYIPQQTLGGEREFGIESSSNQGNVCRIDDVLRNGNAPGTDTGYYCDTNYGSSGAPVLARSSHKVLALHHFGTAGYQCTTDMMNAGVRMDKLWPHISPLFEILPAGDSYESDDVFQDATSIAPNQLQFHSIWPVADEDWITFTLEVETAVSIHTSNAVQNTQLIIYDNNLNQIEQQANDASSNPAIDRVCGVDALPAGNYFIKVSAQEENEEIPEYVIRYNIDEYCSNPNVVLAASTIRIDDDSQGQSIGNNNSSINSGEIVELYIDLTNTGSQTVNEVTGCIREESNFVTGPLYNACSTFGTIDGGSYATNLEDFEFAIASNIPDDYIIELHLDITFDNTSEDWMVSYTIPVHTEYVVYVPMIIK